MKKLLSIMACVAMVLVGGLTLTACCGNGGKTTNATWKDYLDFVNAEGNEIVYDMENWTQTVSVTAKANTVEQGIMGYKGTTKQTNEAIVETVKETGAETRKVSNFSYIEDEEMDGKNDFSSYYSKDHTEERLIGNLYYTTGENDTTPRSVETLTEEQVAEKIQEFTNVYGGKYTDYTKGTKERVEGMFSANFKEVSATAETEYELKDKENSKFTKNVNGKNVTFTFTQTVKDKNTQVSQYEFIKADEKTTISATFNGGKLVEFTQKTEMSNKDLKSTQTLTVKNSGKVTAPKDVKKYVDMTEDGVVASYDGQYDIAEQKFENDGSIEFKLQGNREYKVTGTPSTMDEAKFEKFWGTTEGWDEENAPKYIVIKVNHEDTDEVKFGYVGETAKTLEAEDDGIVLQLNETKKDKKYTITVKDDKNVTTTYTLDLSALYTVAE